MPPKFDFSKILFYVVSVATALGLSFGFGLYSGVKRTAVFQAVSRLRNTVWEVHRNLTTELKISPDFFIQPARKAGGGVTVNKTHDREEQFILISEFFKDTNEMRLIRRNGEVIARWPLDFFRIFPNPTHLHHPPDTNWNVDIHGASMLPDGSVVFNFEHSGLVRVDRCGHVMWALKRLTHHSVEPAEGGSFWVPVRVKYPKGTASPFPPFQSPLEEDRIMKVTEDGRVLKEMSVPGIFYDNGLEALLTSTQRDFRLNVRTKKREILHLNKITELTRDLAGDFPLFDAGDLLLSLRQRNLLMVVDSDSGRVKWWRIGPWIRQHDPQFVPGGKIILFNNNNYLTAFGRNRLGLDISPISPPRYSNIMEIDPVTGRTQILFGDKPGQKMYSILRGKVQRTSTGGLLITEFEGGRALETDADGRVIWEYINRYDSDHVAEMTEAREYPASYFTVSDWTCGETEGLD